MADLKNLKNVSAEDRKILEETEKMMGVEPTEMGFMKNLFWGNIRGNLVFPYPQMTPEQEEKTATLLAKLDQYLRQEHPAIEIDQKQEIPRWVIDRLFELGVMGMTIPEEYGGLGLGITSYNKILERLGRSCASTSVLVSAHQSIGCKALMLFGNETQKKKWLPIMATRGVSAFCLSEPNVGCDASGQETYCERSEDGTYYLLNGEKKWATSGAISDLFTVMCKQKFLNQKTGQEKEGVTALICTPDMEGVDIYQKNRSKCGIRGTWQARIRLHQVKVPRENLLYKEGKGLTVALSCLNYGRCTLSSGVLGAAKAAADQTTKWAQTRYQFGRPLSAFELVQQRLARMSAYNYAIDAMLYMTTGMLDRHDEDIMVETATAKVFASEMGWQVIDDAMQIMAGEGYMTENELERSFRDARLYRIGEGANEVMQAFIFGYGGKQLAEHMLGIQQAYFWNSKQNLGENSKRIIKNGFAFTMLSKAIRLGVELYLGIKQSPPEIKQVHPDLRLHAEKISHHVRDLNHHYKMVSKRLRETILKRQAIQARLADNAMWIHAMVCTLSKLDFQMRHHTSSPTFARDQASAEHLLALAELKIAENTRALTSNADTSMVKAAKEACHYNDTLPHSDFYISEASPVAKGAGKTVDKKVIPQF